MAIFKEFNSTGRDRSAEDRRRHKELVEDSIKKNIGNIIAEESIIGVSKDKKIKIPIKGIKEYQFIYGKNKKGVGSGEGNEKRGDKLGENAQKGAREQGAGNQEGEDVYETEVTLEEVINYLFEDLELPDLDRRKLSEIESESIYRRSGFQKKGIPPRLAKKRSMIEKIKREKAIQRSNDGLADGENERFPFKEDDLRYWRMREDHNKDFNAVVICIMDVSGSMDQTKKYLARSFYFLLYQFLRLRYANVEIVFIAHTTTAKEVTEDEFFHKGESGGTYISSGYEKALEIIETRYNPASWNVYAFHCSDGDNWDEDNQKAIETANQLCEVCNLFGYGEITPGYYSTSSTIRDELAKINKKNFSIVSMNKKEDLLSGLKKLLEKEEEF
jgi:hypothetical protein